MTDLNRKGWTEVSLKEIADCIESHEKDPIKAGLNRWVGLDNIEAENFDIRSSVLSNDGSTFTKAFHPGDILFGKRRPYLRKVAKATFKGLCSNDILIFRPKGPALLRELLPYLLSSNAFTRFAVQTSAGSLSPRTKWRDLASFRFPLPPEAGQRKLLSILNSLEDLIFLSAQHEEQLRKLVKKLIDGFVSASPSFGNLLLKEELMKVKFGDVTSKITRKIDPLTANIQRVVAGENLASEDLRIRSWGTIGSTFIGPAFHVLFKKGDILYGSRRTYLRKVALAEFDGVCANTTYVVQSSEESLLQHLLKYIMLSEPFTQFSISVSKGSTNPYINWGDLNNFEFQIPRIEIQRKMVSLLDKIIEIAEEVRSQRACLRGIKHGLLDSVLENEFH